MMLTPPWQAVAPVRYSKSLNRGTLSAKLSAVCAFWGLLVYNDDRTYKIQF